MASYGFRIHTIHPHVRRTQEYLQIQDVSLAGGKVDALDQVYEEILALQGKTCVGTPTYYQNEEVESARLAENDKAEDLPYFTVLNVSKVGRVLTVLVETGKEADHDALVSRDGTHQEMKNKAAVRRSNVIIEFPKSGEAALMVSEVRGRSYAGDLLIQWLTRTAQREMISVDGKGNRKEDDWLNWKISPRIDGDRLDGILTGSSDHTLKLRRKTVNASGARTSYDIELTQIGLKTTTVQRLLDVLTAMANRRTTGTENDRRAAAAKDVLSLVEPKVGGVGFDDGELSFLEKGKRQTINSETVDQLFVYPVGSKRPDAHDLRSQSAAIVKRIATGLGIPTQ